MEALRSQPGLSAEDYDRDLDRVAGDLGAVEDAMRRLDDGTYGRCGRCGREIPEEQLSGDPLVTACPEHVTSVPQ